MNTGQLELLVRARYMVDTVSYTKIAGVPFQVAELTHVISDNLGELPG
ncbi:MAG: hypothetical protein ACYCU5_10880 [Actinomycetes bacterium]